jgi:hypothetical protein
MAKNRPRRQARKKEKKTNKEGFDQKPKAIEDKGAPDSAGNRNMHFFYGLGFQITFGVLFVIALSFFFYYLDKNVGRSLWSGFAAWVFIGLAITLLVQQHFVAPLEVLTPQPLTKPGDPNSPDVISGSDSTITEPFTVNVSPDDLMKFYRDHTDAQAGKLLEPYIAKRMKASGIVQNVSTYGSTVTIFIQLPTKQHMFNDVVTATFTNSKLTDRALTIRRGDEVTVLGTIQSVRSDAVSLTDCSFSE